MRIFSETENRKKISVLRHIPSHIEYTCGTPAIAYFSDGSSCALGCLGCVNPKCMRFDTQEIVCSEAENFPSDHSLNVCPVEALSWDVELDIPMVNMKKCINCGICINRCPVGAIYFNGTVKVNDTLSDKIISGAANSAVTALQTEQLALLNSVRKSGQPIIESNKLFQSIYEKLLKVKSNYHNIIARNLLISLGCRSAMRRIGDIYTRMDAVYSSTDRCFGAVEVEFGRDTLDASRGILDDVAVLNTRYGINKEINIPLVVCLQLPNARQGYWQVVKDIKIVENISINTMTIYQIIQPIILIMIIWICVQLFSDRLEETFM